MKHYNLKTIVKLAPFIAGLTIVVLILWLFSYAGDQISAANTAAGF